MLEDAVTPLSSLLPLSCSTSSQGMAAGPGQMKVTLPVSAGHGSGLLWLTSPAEPWPQASPAFCTVSLAPATSPLPHEGLLHLPASISASCPSCPAFLIQPHCRQHMGTVTHRQLIMGGFGKYYSTAAGQGSEGGLGQDLVPVHCRMATG